MKRHAFFLFSIFGILSFYAPFLQAQTAPVPSPAPLPIVSPPTSIPKKAPAQQESLSSPGLVEEGIVPPRAQEILDFWFGPLKNPFDYPTRQSAVWYAGTAPLNSDIRSRFEDDVKRAMLGEYNEWRESPRGRLALILLLDQFPRYIYQGQRRVFASDAMARGLVIEGLQRGDHLKLYLIERAFFYLPLKHAESIRLQNLSVELYRRLVEESPPFMRPQMQVYLDEALAQRNVIARFGRFPTRNSILGRRSTPQEIIYLHRLALSRS